VSKVADHLVAPKENKGYAKSLDATKWCINNKGNMIALPRWGHTIMWYCSSIDEVSLDSKGIITAGIQALQPDSVDLIRPPFKDLPQHDYGHRGRDTAHGYEQEVGERLEKFSNSLEEAVDNHDEGTLKQIAQTLNGLSSHFRNELKRRGKRAYGGTHGAWKAAAQNPAVPDWYQPFSMASVPKPMAFPAGKFNEGLGRKIKRIAAALFKLNSSGL
jgi:hypothetical protein